MTDLRMADVDVGKATYERFGWVIGHKTEAGEPMPPWQGLSEKQQTAWRAAAYAAVEQQQKLSRRR